MPHSPPHSVTSFISVPRAPIHSLGQNQYRRFSLIQIQVHMYVLLFGEKKPHNLRIQYRYFGCMAFTSLLVSIFKVATIVINLCVSI